MSNSDGGMRRAEISDEFVITHAVPVDEAESFVHIDLDSASHPTGGYWFPTGQKWGEATGWVSRKYDIPKDELVQFPCDDREPEIRGRDDLPGWVANRVVDGGDLEGFEEKRDELWEGLLTAYAAGFSKAAETFDVDPEYDTDVNSLTENDAVAEFHYYFWDGRTLPLEFWLRDQFNLDQEEDDGE